MFTYILRRVLLMFPTLLGAVTLIFLIMRLLPGDAALYILGSDEAGQVNREALQQIRQSLGLDQPLIVQYGQWLWGVARLDFGDSYWTKQPVMHELGQRYAMTANLAILSLVVSTAIAIPIGVLSALKQDTVADYAARVFVITGLSVPNFWLAILIILGLVHYFRWLPPPRLCAVLDGPLAELQAAHLSRHRDGVPALRHQRADDAIQRTRGAAGRLRAHGAGQGAARTRVVVKHALKNALLPVITITSVELLVLFGGLVVVETVFTIPGIGRFLVDAIIHRDYPSIQALVFVFAAFVVVVNLLVDILYSFLDPRIRVS